MITDEDRNDIKNNNEFKMPLDSYWNTLPSLQQSP